MDHSAPRFGIMSRHTTREEIVGSTEPHRLDPRPVSAVRMRPEMLRRPWSGRVQRGKLRIPALPDEVVLRPRLTDRIDEHPCPLTVIVAPAGFGKTTLAAAWARAEPAAAWLTIDAADVSLLRFWAHLRAAVSTVFADFGGQVTEAIAMPFRASPRELGHLAADELLEAPAPVRLVIDDLHLIPAGDVLEFLAGVLEFAPPALRLLITARSDPALPLARYRLRGQLRELRGADLLFTEAETASLVNQMDGPPRDAGDVATLWRSTGGWAAGLRLATLAPPSLNVDHNALRPLTDFEHLHLATLVEESLAEQPQTTHDLLLRASLLDRFNLQVLTAIGLPPANPDAVVAAVRFALSADLCRSSPTADGTWLEFHPVFRAAFRRRLTTETSRAARREMHRQAAAWFEAAAMADAAISHWLEAGETAAAVTLAEREIQPRLDREDWPSVARWVSLFPDAVVRERPHLLLARGYVAHFRGQSLQLQNLLASIEEQLDPRTWDDTIIAEFRTEADLLRLSTLVPFQIDPRRGLATAQRCRESLPVDKRFQRGLVATMEALGLQATGRGEAIEEPRTAPADRDADRWDSETVRQLYGSIFPHWIGGRLDRVESMALAATVLADQHGLRLSACWARRFLGDVLYERDDLDGAIEQYEAVARDYEYFHLVGLRETMLSLALAYHAAGRERDAERALVRCRDCGVVEDLSRLRAHARRIHKTIPTDPDLVISRGQIGNDVAAKIVGHDALGIAGRQVGGFGDHPHTGFRTVWTGHHAADIITVDRDRLLLLGVQLRCARRFNRGEHQCRNAAKNKIAQSHGEFLHFLKSG